jgi:hypothetical protein
VQDPCYIKASEEDNTLNIIFKKRGDLIYKVKWLRGVEASGWEVILYCSS